MPSYYLDQSDRVPWDAHLHIQPLRLRNLDIGIGRFKISIDAFIGQEKDR